LSFGNKNPQDSQNIDYSNILSLIKSRRSIRHYKQEEISEDLMNQLKEMLPYIPTGCNAHSLHFSIVEKKEVMEQLKKKVNSSLLKVLSSKIISPITKKFKRYKTALERGEDIIYRNAPHMIVVSAPITTPCLNVDPIIALSYFELYAQSVGIGTCWCGFADACMKVFPEISEMLEIPQGYKPIYTMLFGYPDVTYQRTPQPEPYKISEIKSVKNVNFSWLKRIKHIIKNLNKH
jgi:nitroreductase